MLDAHVRALYAEVPMVAQWDDHETRNNWYPGEVFYDRGTPNVASTCSPHGRAGPGSEYMPIADARAPQRGRRP